MTISAPFPHDKNNLKKTGFYKGKLRHFTAAFPKDSKALNFFSSSSYNVERSVCKCMALVLFMNHAQKISQTTLTACYLDSTIKSEIYLQQVNFHYCRVFQNVLKRREILQFST
ncbi:hypothetical protein CDAR_478781 [Caerostris darwini]|uniref:Uncharacterized protein n=1 Tax=Caerostris darwini TaxID=1538125 RepID=A0AAV4X2M2_9ARAC|nr:hypothetical protein CDAR_478781 [Caerostris darwini]